MSNWVVIPVRGNVELLREAVDSALAQDIGEIKLFIVNNSKPGDSVASYLRTLQGFGHIVASFYPQIGVAGAWNHALNHLFLAEQVDKVLVINQDVELPPTLYSILDRSIRYDELKNATHFGEFVTAVSVNDRSKLRDYVVSHELRPHPDFSCFLIRRSVWDKVGEFDTRYWPAYCEDSDFHVRMHRAGVYAYCIDIPFYHVGAGTIKNATQDEKKALETFAENNRRLFFNDYGKRIGVPEEYNQLFTVEAFGGGDVRYSV